MPNNAVFLTESQIDMITAHLTPEDKGFWVEQDGEDIVISNLPLSVAMTVTPGGSAMYIHPDSPKWDEIVAKHAAGDLKLAEDPDIRPTDNPDDYPPAA